MSVNFDLFPDAERLAESAHTTGILPSQLIRDLVAQDHISAVAEITEKQIQPASIDLRLGDVAYRVRSSFLPGKSTTVEEKLKRLTMHKIDLTQPAALERGCVYIVPLAESLNLPKGISAKANPKSTTGRLDIFTRLVTDYGEEFESVPAGYAGKLYLEVSPRTFSVLVRAGDSLNQIRFWRGSPRPSDLLLKQLHEQERLVYSEGDAEDEPRFKDGMWISVDLVGNDSDGVIGYRAKTHTPMIDLSRIDFYDPNEFWEPLRATSENSLILDPNAFYILVSKEKIVVPPTVAAEMVAYDTSVGEFRIHYAGFFDPGFGHGKGSESSTPAVLEVRSHEVPFLLEQGQLVGRLVYERLMSVPEQVYGPDIGSSYQQQGLCLSKQFKRS